MLSCSVRWRAMQRSGDGSERGVTFALSLIASFQGVEASLPIGQRQDPHTKMLHKYPVVQVSPSGSSSIAHLKPFRFLCSLCTVDGSNFWEMSSLVAADYQACLQHSLLSALCLFCFAAIHSCPFSTACWGREYCAILLLPRRIKVQQHRPNCRVCKRDGRGSSL